MTRVAVVMFNLGGPDSPDAIQPFLNNLFNDPAIIALPWPLRPVLASAISRKREKEARGIYARIGGRSPILDNTRVQAEKLQERLADENMRVFVAMRYWHPLSEDVALEVAAFAPDRIVLLPLYPQFSTTTTGSFLTAWTRACRMAGLDAPTTAVCCYPVLQGLVARHAELLGAALDEAGDAPVRVLFSAHGLPEKIVRGGDPYAWQVERTSAAIAACVARDGLRLAGLLPVEGRPSRMDRSVDRRRDPARRRRRQGCDRRAGGVRERAQRDPCRARHRVCRAGAGGRLRALYQGGGARRRRGVRRGPRGGHQRGARCRRPVRVGGGRRARMSGRLAPLSLREGPEKWRGSWETPSLGSGRCI